ncbi:MAG: hypothetical protein V3G42_00875 [Oscillospiraceae bacterium]
MTATVLYPKLEATMIEKGISRQDLADLLEISIDGLNKRMRGVIKFSPSEEMVLSDFLDVPRAELFRKREEGKA